MAGPVVDGADGAGAGAGAGAAGAGAGGTGGVVTVVGTAAGEEVLLGIFGGGVKAAKTTRMCITREAAASFGHDKAPG